MIILYTDFGIGSPYTGQLKAVLHQETAHLPIIDLHADLASFNVRAAAYLLAAYVEKFPPESVFLCIVDPGVGSARRPVAVQCQKRWFIGPDNGLFKVLPLHFADTRMWEIVWRPDRLSSTFHGRDLFAPVAARISRGDATGLRILENRPQQAWPADCWEIVYVDHYGNLFSGLRASQLAPSARLQLNGRSLYRAATFSDVAEGSGFWYENSIGLVEITVNQGRADTVFQAGIGTDIHNS